RPARPGRPAGAGRGPGRTARPGPLSDRLARAGTARPARVGLLRPGAALLPGGAARPARRGRVCRASDPRAGPPAAARPLDPLAGTARPGTVLVVPGRLVG